MRTDEIRLQCCGKDEEIIWARKGSRELVAYRKNVVYIAPKGLVSDIRASKTAKLTQSDKLKKYFDVIERIERGEGRAEGFVSERKTLDSGIEAICIESMEGVRKWVDRKLLENFAYKRRYWFDDNGWYNGMVFIEEENELKGIIMILNVK